LSDKIGDLLDEINVMEDENASDLASDEIFAI